MQGTSTGDKNEILWLHKINYQLLPEQFRKVLIRQLSAMSRAAYPAHFHEAWAAIILTARPSMSA